MRTRVVLVQSAGQVEVRLAGSDGDWDVALFDGTENAVAAAASPDSQEIATGWVLAPGTLTLQSCRNSGTGAVRATVAHTPVTGDAAKARAEAPQLVSVRTPTRADKDRLVALALDMNFGTRTAAANRTDRLSLPARKLARGDYKVRLVARAGAETVTSTLVSRRL